MSQFAGFALVFLAVVLVMGLIAWLKARTAQQRRAALFTFATQLGLTYSREDPLGLLWYPFALFTKGDGRGVENVVHGTWDDIPLAAFDYSYYEQTTDSEGRTHRTHHRFSCALAEVEAALSPLTIGRESALTRLADAVGLDDIAFESDEFNRAFEVRCADRRFASAFVDQRMMEWLLEADRRFSFATGGRWLLATGPRLQVEAFDGLFSTLRDFHSRVPRVIPSLFPLTPPAPEPGSPIVGHAG